MKRAYLCLVLIGLSVVRSYAAVIYLKDGSRVTGTIVSATARDIEFHTPNGMLTISNERIDHVDYADLNASGPAPASFPASAEPESPPASKLNLYEPLKGYSQYFSFGLGGAIPFGRVDFSGTGGGTDDNGDSSILASGQYLYQVSSRWSAGLSLDYMHRSRTASQSLVPASTTDVFGDSWVFMPLAKFSIIDKGVLRPYLAAGVGLNRTSTIIEAAPNPGFQWSDTKTFETRTLVDEGHWGLASTLRAGLDFYSPWDPQVLSLEMGWTQLSNSSYDATAAGRDLGLESVTGDLGILTVAFRFGWRF